MNVFQSELEFHIEKIEFFPAQRSAISLFNPSKSHCVTKCTIFHGSYSNHDKQLKYRSDYLPVGPSPLVGRLSSFGKILSHINTNTQKGQSKTTNYWEQRKLDNLTKVTTGKAFNSDDFDEQGEYLVITNKNILDQTNGIESTGDHIDANQQTANRYSLGGDNILITMDGVNIGKVGRYTDSKAVLAQRVGRLTGKGLPFVFQLVDNSQFLAEMNKIAVGNAIKHISLKQIANYTICVPKSDIEKVKIGSLLTHLTDTIALHQRPRPPPSIEKSRYTLTKAVLLCVYK